MAKITMIEEYFVERKPVNKEQWRPEYHFTPPCSWMNDPNGLIYYKGWYHVFYQYHPDSCDWGSMHWGHAVSKDMLHWKDLPIALYPDQPYDRHEKGGCFSGSAVEKDGNLYCFYTSTTIKNEKVIQTQSLAMSEDGVHFRKYENNPVIASAPDGIECDFRDPKVLKAGDAWYMVTGASAGGACKADSEGRILLYKSCDLLHWDFAGTLLKSREILGTMPECPDLFCLDGKWVLTCSPIMNAENTQSVYCVGEVDFEKCEFHVEKTGAMDLGFDYYAPQSFLDKNGNRIVMAWANEWDWMPWFRGWGPTDRENWRGTFSVPRKARLDSDGNLLLSPIDELISLQGETAVYENYLIEKRKKFIPLSHPYSYRLHMNLKVPEDKKEGIEVGIFAGEDRYVSLQIDFADNLLTFCDENAGNCYGGKRTANISVIDGKMDLVLLVDHSIIEIFVNDGKHCISCNVYPEKDQTGLWMKSFEKELRLEKLEISGMESVWK